MHTAAICFFGIAALFGAEALQTSGRCAAKHQDLLQLAASVKKECGEIENQDCCTGAVMASLYKGFYPSSTYQIQSSCSSFRDPFQSSRTRLASCDMTTDNGGWLVIFKRDKTVSSPVNFNRDWIDYETGFGDLDTEFWYGLREMHCLTQKPVDMRIDLTATNGTKFYWTYGQFVIDGPETKYRLHIGQPVGSLGTHTPDAITRHVKSGGTPFTTRDRDNDGLSSSSCASDTTFGNGGGWWWYQCSYAYLTRPATSMWWYEPNSITLSHVEMKIRPKSCHQTLETCS